MKGVTTEYAKTLGLSIGEGKGFSYRTSGADAKTMILNESSVRAMGLKDPIGITVTWMKHYFTVIGVVKNMVMESPYEIAGTCHVLSGALDHDEPLTMRINPRLSAHEAIRRISPV